MANIINGTDTGSGGLITTGDSSDELQLQTAETARVTLTNTAVVVNEGGNDVDFRVEGDTEANLLFVDASTDKVGIGTATPLFLSTTGSASCRVLGIRNSGTISATRGEIQIGSAATADGEFVGGILFGSGASTTTNNTTAGIYSVCEGSNTTTGQGRLEFYTTASGGTLTERMRITSDGYLRMASGSGGIQFGGDTAAANALDDYEEGTWTPAQGSGLVVVGAYSSGGQYTKIGRMVTVFGYLAGATSVSASGNSQICTGLPFAPNAEFQGSLINAARTFSSNVGALASGAVQCSEGISATNNVSFTITYFV